MKLKKEVDKELKKKEQIADGVAKIDEAHNALKSLASRYDAWIDEAFEFGEIDYSDELMNEQTEIEIYASNFLFLRTLVIKNAVSANTFSSLKKLPMTLSACESLLKDQPDFNKLTAQMTKLKDSLKKTNSSLKDLRRELAATKDPVFNDLFGKKATDDPEFKAKLEAKKKAREARLAAKLSSPSVPIPVSSEAGFTSSATDIDAITAMIDEENRKN